MKIKQNTKAYSLLTKEFSIEKKRKPANIIKLGLLIAVKENTSALPEDKIEILLSVLNNGYKRVGSKIIRLDGFDWYFDNDNIATLKSLAAVSPEPVQVEVKETEEVEEAELFEQEESIEEPIEETQPIEEVEEKPQTIENAKVIGFCDLLKRTKNTNSPAYEKYCYDFQGDDISEIEKLMESNNIEWVKEKQRWELIAQGEENE